MDAGGLAQMTYNNFQSNGGIGLPSAGFASRGKGASLKRLNVASPPKVASIAENSVETPTPRTSRSHLLAGLRTAPKTPTSAQPPASAPYGQHQHSMESGYSGYSSQYNNRQGFRGIHRQNAPQTAVGSGFSTLANQYGHQQQQMIYDQVLAPPSIEFEEGDIDPTYAAQLLATELYLAQRQQQLQQQLLNLTAQQFGTMNLNAGGMRQSQPFPSTPFTPQMNGYVQQQFQHMPVSQQTNQPGVYVAYDHTTGQYNYVLDPSFQQNHQGGNEIRTQVITSNLSQSPPPPTPSFTSSPPKVDTPTFQVSPPNEANPSPWGSRSSSPPKKENTPPQEVVPLPPPSANAFRRGHKKTLSSLALDGKAADTQLEGPRSAMTPRVGFPATPNTGTFGPGQARAGEHPVRQPRGPPPLEELQVSPTTKHEGSKNFATRQRRQAVNNLVRAGIGRRGVRTGSAGSMTPVSETEMSFPLPSDDSDSVHSAGSGSLSSKPSIGSLRAAANGAIGSERKERKERSIDRSPNSPNSDVGNTDARVVDESRSTSGQRRKMPMLVLTSAEKRKSSMF